MSTYLLLRNNKETGPLSMDQLLEKGLKAYDLVWVEGKSAAWRYPSEIEELKPYAPVVEEQPFDRFFKKPSEQTTQQELAESKPVASKQAVAEPKPAVEKKPAKEVVEVPEKYEAYMPPAYQTENGQKQVFVSLPNDTKPAAVKPEPVAKPAMKEPVHAAPYEEQVAEKVVRLEKRFEQPIEEITDKYAQALIDRKRKSSRRRQFNGLLTKATPFLLVLGIGVAIGLYLNRDKDGANGATDVHDVATNEAKNTPSNLQIIPAVRTDNELTDQTTSHTATDENNGTQQVENLPPGTTVKLKKVRKNLTGDKSLNYDNTTAPGTELDPQSGERSKVIRDANAENAAANQAPEETMSFKDLMKRIYVSNNNYTKGAFGGIKNLELTVMNNTKYLLDEVTVELQYLKPSELPLKSETLRFTSVAPNGTMTIKIPDSQRGVKISYRVIKVNSRQLSDALAKNS